MTMQSADAARKRAERKIHVILIDSETNWNGKAAFAYVACQSSISQVMSRKSQKTKRPLDILSIKSPLPLIMAVCWRLGKSG
jgi:hypothetical protein